MCCLHIFLLIYYDLPCVTKNRLRELTNTIQLCSQCTDIRRSYMYEEKIAEKRPILKRVERGGLRVRLAEQKFVIC